MSSIPTPISFTANTLIKSADVNSNFTAINTVVNGSLDNSNLSASAAVAVSKLAHGSAYQVIGTASDGTTVQWGAVNLAQSAAVTGILAIANGGTNSSTSLNNNRVMISSGGAIVENAALSASLPMKTNASGLPTAAAINIASGSTEVTGTLPITSGGTGQITANAALNALLPSQASASGKFLTSNGTDTSWANQTAAPTQSYELANLGLACSVATSALTIALKQSDGSTDPASGTGAVKIGFRSSTSSSGLYNERSATAATSLVVSSGSTLGTASGTTEYLYVYAIDNAGTVELAISHSLYDDGSIVSTTAEGGAGAADSNALIYSTTARANVPLRLIARLKVSEATAGTWATAPSEVSLVPFKNQPVFARYYISSARTPGASGTYAIINFDSATEDTRNCVTTGASWKFTAPEAGLYMVSVRYANSGQGANNYFITSIFKNGSNYARLTDPYVSGAGEEVRISCGTPLRLAKDDYIDFRAASATATTGSSATGSDVCYIAIAQIPGL